MNNNIEYLRTYGSAAVIQIQVEIYSGLCFHDAKNKVCKKLMKNHACDAKTRSDLYALLQSISLGDMSKDTIRLTTDRTIASIESARGKKMGFFERRFYKVTGMTM